MKTYFIVHALGFVFNYRSAHCNVSLLESQEANECVFGCADAEVDQCRRKQAQKQVLPDSSLRAFFPDNYDKTLPPFPKDEPLMISFYVKARDVQNVDEQNMEITVEWYIRVLWSDYRLIPPINVTSRGWLVVDPDLIEYIWLPATYIGQTVTHMHSKDIYPNNTIRICSHTDHVKEITSPVLLTKPHSVRFFSSGLIRYSSSKTTRLSCPMEFSAYPFDQQQCVLAFEDYQHSFPDVTYNWRQPVEIGISSKPLQFEVQFKTEDKNSTLHDGVQLPRAAINIILTRAVTNYIMNTYLPSTLLVVVSWLSFLVPPEQVPGRMVLSITTLLTLMAMFSSVRSEGPKVSYLKAIDQWMLTCVFFVFLVMVEFSVVLYLLGKAAKYATLGSVRKFPDVTAVSPLQTNDKKPVTAMHSSLKYQRYADQLEKWSWILLMISFVLFAIVYWFHWYI